MSFVEDVEQFDREQNPQQPAKVEAVHHPSHYEGKNNPHEVIKVMESWLTPEEFCGAVKFNIHKYLARAGKKGGSSADEDIAKAAWYAEYLDDYNTRKLG